MQFASIWREPPMADPLILGIETSCDETGIAVVDSIAAERTVSVSGVGSDVPARGVLLNSIHFL